MALIYEISLKFPLFSPHHRPRTHYLDTFSFTEARYQPSLFNHMTHTLYGRTRLYGSMALIYVFSRKFPLFSPHHRPHTHSLNAFSFTEARYQPSLFNHMTHPLYGRTRLYGSMALIYEFSRKFPLFSPHHRPHTHSLNAFSFTEAQRYHISRPLTNQRAIPLFSLLAVKKVV